MNVLRFFCLQNPNGEIKISIPAQYQNIRSIFEVSNVGVVYLKQSLMNTNSAVYKVSIKTKGMSERCFSSGISEIDIWNYE